MEQKVTLFSRMEQKVTVLSTMEYTRNKSITVYTSNETEARILESAKIVRENEDYILCLTDENAVDYVLKAPKIFFVSQLIGSFDSMPKVSKMFVRMDGSDTKKLLFDYEEAERKHREKIEKEDEKERKEKREAREAESARILKGEDFVNLLSKKGDKRKKRESKINPIVLYAPNTLPSMSKKLTRIQKIVLSRVVTELQPYVRKAITNHHNEGKDTIIMPESGQVEISVPLSDFTDRNHYKKIQKEIEELASTQIILEVEDEEGSGYEIVNVLESAFVPMEGNRKVIKCTTTRKITYLLCNPFLPEEKYKNIEEVQRGFYSFSGSVIELVSSKITQDIYMLLSRKKNIGKEFIITPESLKERLDLQDKYTRWSMFKKRILDEPMNELEENSYRFDISFSYTPIYENRKSDTGYPDKIRFKIIDNREREEYMKFKKELESLQNKLCSLGITQDQANNLLKPIDNKNLQYAKSSLEKVIKMSENLKNPPAFIYKKFYSAIEYMSKQLEKGRAVEDIVRELEI